MADQAEGATTLHHLARDGTDTVLGRWRENLITASIPFQPPYVVDPTGCVVLYDTDLDTPGAHLALLPGAVREH